MNIFYYDIAINVPLRKCFTYKSNTKISAGTRVQVSFGTKKVLGIVVRKLKKINPQIKKNTIKDVISIDKYKCFDKPTFDSVLWASEYYHHPIGEVFFSFIPTTLRKDASKKITHIKTKINYSINEENKSFALNDEQKKAVNNISKIKGFAPSLLYGVTGSGKTEVYLRLTEDYIKKDKSVLILVPEINLTPQLINRFKNRFNGEIGVFHSNLTPKKRFETWLKSKFGAIKIVIGTRSSIMMPLDELGLIIVDEEHDQSYRQSEGFKFSARDMAIKRSQIDNIPLVLGSATPSLQTLKLVSEKKFKKFEILKRIDGKSPPKLIALDINNSQLIEGIAEESMTAIEKTISKGEQALVFINRRGFAPLSECADCGWVASCKLCDSNLVFHKSKNRLICHKCESVFNVSKTCPECKSSKIKTHGLGTEKIEEVFKSKFVNIPIIRFDHDSTKRKGSLEKIYSQIHESRAAILVGTQMLTKGHDFPRVTMCVILNADNGLISPELNAIEKISQQLIQVSGRAGRNNNLAKVIIQTRYPDDLNLKKIKTGNYKLIADQCLENSKLKNFPPYSSICLLRCTSPNLNNCLNFLNRAHQILKSKNKLSAVGPLPSIPAKVKGNSRFHLILQSSTKTYLNRVLKFLINEFENWPEAKKIKWSFDIDPYDMS
tara:strand:- start:2805 stop:4790 length:1986 start_codon:yes stop_codon:yes gene_type:complete